jgi:predicted pyridoxine 5'-phosphate oxidase superfamily flavin-nucleotide-binding protein
VDLEKFMAYQFKGTVDLLESGPVYEQVKEELKNSPKALPEPKYVAKITVEEIYDQSPGPNAGKKMG